MIIADLDIVFDFLGFDDDSAFGFCSAERGDFALAEESFLAEIIMFAGFVKFGCTKNASTFPIWIKSGDDDCWVLL